MSSDRVQHVLSVVKDIQQAGPESLGAVRPLRIEACQARARKCGITSDAVKDACCREMRTEQESYTIDDFDRDVWAWLSSGDPSSLRRRLERHVPRESREEDLAAIERFFGPRGRQNQSIGPVSLPEYIRTRGWVQCVDECHVRAEGEEPHVSLVVAAVADGARRSRGLNALMHWASHAFGIRDVGVHPEGGTFERFTEPPNPGVWAEGGFLEAAMRSDPLGIGPGERLRIVLDRGTLDTVRSMLPWVMGWPPGRVVVQHACEALRARRLTFSDEQVADFYLSLRVKPLVLLAGISGTGKSLLPRCFAEAFGFECTTIPVRPDWSDPGDLVGYRNLKNAFVPGRLLRPIVQAWRQPDRPFFVMLDEMNLARVEHYFADVLSVIETRRERDGRVVTDPLLTLSPDDEIHGDAADVAALREVLRAGPLGLPPNLTFVGTVNMDESTHPFSKKVLDRAMTLEFTIGDDDLQRVLSPAAPPGPPPSGAGASWAGPTPPGALVQPDLSKLATVVDALVALNRSLTLCSAQVGYRVRDEVCRYVWLAAEEGVLPERDALDLALHHKLLPRLQGGRELERVLKGLAEEASTRGLRRCREKLDAMKERLEDTGYTSFWA